MDRLGLYAGVLLGIVIFLLAMVLVFWEPDVVPPAPRPVAATGQQLYEAYCIACHQRSGAGLPPAFPPLAGAPILDDKAALIRTTLFGRPGTAMADHCRLDAADLAALLTYVRGTWGSQPAEPVLPEEVLRARAEPPSPCRQRG